MRSRKRKGQRRDKETGEGETQKGRENDALEGGDRRGKHAGAGPGTTPEMAVGTRQRCR